MSLWCLVLAAVVGADCDTPPSPAGLEGRVLCGYQGWFAAEGDGSGRGWVHYARGGEPRPGGCKFDLWPDLGEFGADEQYPTAFRHADGRVATLFSSLNRQTVLRHFRWMRDYGIDGALLQRYPIETRGGPALKHTDTVLALCREAARAAGRVYAVMYATQPGPRFAGELELIQSDWQRLVDQTHLTADPQYLRDKGRPLVAIWGIGFNDGRAFTLDQVARLVEFFHRDPRYGGCAVMLGVPSGWRTLDRDSIAEADLHRVLQAADVLSPWTVGRYRTPEAAAEHARRVWAPDAAWCAARGLEYLPVVYPGCSWHNMYPQHPSDMIPRCKGQFLWQQFTALRECGLRSAFVAMFDEIDEGTAIFKCTNDPPRGESPFLNYEGLSSDFYLWLTGQGGRLLRGEIGPSAGIPARP